MPSDCKWTLERRIEPKVGKGVEFTLTLPTSPSTLLPLPEDRNMVLSLELEWKGRRGTGIKGRPAEGNPLFYSLSNLFSALNAETQIPSITSSKGSIWYVWERGECGMTLNPSFLFR